MTGVYITVCVWVYVGIYLATLWLESVSYSSYSRTTNPYLSSDYSGTLLVSASTS